MSYAVEGYFYLNGIIIIIMYLSAPPSPSLCLLYTHIRCIFSLIEPLFHFLLSSIIMFPDFTFFFVFCP